MRLVVLAQPEPQEANPRMPLGSDGAALRRVTLDGGERLVVRQDFLEERPIGFRERRLGGHLPLDHVVGQARQRRHGLLACAGFRLPRRGLRRRAAASRCTARRPPAPPATPCPPCRTTTPAATRPAAMTGPRCRRANFRTRYAPDGGHACTGSSARYRSTSARQPVRRLVAARAVLLQRLHHDPVQLPAHELPEPPRVGLAVGRDGRELLAEQRADPRARPRRLLLADDPADLVVRRLAAAAPCRTASCRSAARTAARRASRRRCACRRPGRSSPPARGSCTAACRPSARTA